MLWLLVVIIGLVTYALRLSFIAAAGSVELPLVVRRALRFVPVAVLSAMIAPALVHLEASMQLNWDSPRLLAGLVAIVIAWRTGSMLATIAGGMVALWVLQALFA
ncbi:MAG: AzlD domain-containing protein [Chloroflexaceae bacterium]|nr:AzlD domain-containing protein [Chloroflexaceae bacterium]